MSLVFFILVNSFYPIQKLLSPLAAFVGAFLIAGSKAVTSSLVLDIAMVDFVSGQSGIKQDGVMVFHRWVVNTIDEKHRRTVGGDMAF